MNTTASEPAMTVLLGLPFHNVTLAETLEFCRTTMKGAACRYLVTANVDFTTQAYDDEDLRKIVFFADRVVCDGMPLVWLSKAFGSPLRERVAGSDMVPKLLEICGREGLSVYFFGSDQATLEEAKGIVEKHYPGLRVVGVDSPPYGAVVEWDNDALCARMRASGAHLLLACLGCPKQERWIFAHHRETGIPLSIGVGASLDFITGKQKRAPLWMQKTGLEWFWRMAGNPSRLAARYGHDLLFLTKAGFRQAWSQRRREDLAVAHTAVPVPPAHGGPQVQRLAWMGELRKSALDGAPLPEAVDRPVLLDASRVAFTDSSGLGRLAMLVRLCRAAGQALVVVNPSGVFRGAIRDSQMDSLFEVAESDADALRFIRSAASTEVCRKVSEDGVAWVSFSRPLDALYHEEMMSVLEAAVSGSEDMRSLVVDLGGVSFIDSRAVGGLIRMWKTMNACGGGLYIARPTPPVREIIGLLRLDKVLPEWKGALPE
jgi:N-acetylglucosaminyldiphosphoundecaprenol N-acetyl-beta-D-mannosaminyltransferase